MKRFILSLYYELVQLCAGQMVYTKVALKLPYVSGAKVVFCLFTPDNFSKSPQVVTHSQTTMPSSSPDPLRQEKPEKSPLPELCKLDPPTITESPENFG